MKTTDSPLDTEPPATHIGGRQRTPATEQPPVDFSVEFTMRPTSMALHTTLADGPNAQN